MSTLGLNMIVGAGESHLLDRCLTTFNAKENFDEIVIVNTSLDEKVTETAKKYTDKVLYFQWFTEEYPFGNFGGARDFARMNSTADKLMWLDTDDVLQEQHKSGFVQVVETVKGNENKEVIIWLMPYVILIDKHGNPEQTVMRERIFDRNRIVWTRACHELMSPPCEFVKHARIKKTCVTHLPIKTNYESGTRNVAILEDEYKKDPKNMQTRYFLGRELMYIGQVDRGMAILEKILQDMAINPEMLYAIAIDLCWFYAYGKPDPCPELPLFKKHNILKVEGYARLALTFSFIYAEPYMLLGDVYYLKGERDAALRMYMTAMKKTYGAGVIQNKPLYSEIPANRISNLCVEKQLYSLALHYNFVAINSNRQKVYLEQRKNLIEKLVEEYNDLLKDPVNV